MDAFTSFLVAVLSGIVIILFEYWLNNRDK
ncbi:type I toxin-antitoxin system Fst family toxin [Streptococcus equi]|uniref:Type I toxin-antitoxin system Fst family toxin n=1 Tax=Streptococcus equi subsp. ruminatorum TaxID=254358 RepID=A0A6M1KNQ1_9STRE|nr:type I toxin-antitoxin system Fst family toxin [Streptococcus equi]NGL83563.1 type I toxin-antitoxin system Fst family toxin [Streptococcus equi subsp. ruminatorum]WKF67174.1 type I toxin-antitoxin system Fst family toxin [Streptococcus equi subsp. zooepidemicus]HEK9097705.1 type I toxin-antitoxin system Fst family toxin [Streptococcus equi subsp. zooepidemicus]